MIDPNHDGRRALYGISVAADLCGVDPQSMRLYERRGLLTPSRTDGGTRRYSDDDVTRLRRIAALTDAGVNLTGIAHIFRLEAHRDELQADNSRLLAANQQLESDNARLESDNARLRAERNTHD